MKLRALLIPAFAIIAAMTLAEGAHAQTPPDVGFSIGIECPPGYVLTNRNNAASCVEEINQATNAQNADNAQNAVQAQNAQTALNATTAGTALNLDPNATIDIGNLSGLPSCNDGRVLTNTPAGLECVQVATGARGFANKQYVTAHNGTFNVPAGVFEMRVTAAAGNTVQYRQNYGITGYTYGVVGTTPVGAYCWGDDSGSGCACNGNPQVGYPDCLNYTYGNIAQYGCQTPSQMTVPAQSGTKTFAVTPGQSFKALLASVQTPVAVAAPHNQCAGNYDIVYSAIAELPSGAPEPNIYSDKRNGENPGEMSVASAMIVEW